VPYFINDGEMARRTSQSLSSSSLVRERRMSKPPFSLKMRSIVCALRSTSSLKPSTSDD
jgi:hypothetical protein